MLLEDCADDVKTDIEGGLQGRLIPLRDRRWEPEGVAERRNEFLLK